LIVNLDYDCPLVVRWAAAFQRAAVNLTPARIGIRFASPRGLVAATESRFFASLFRKGISHVAEM